MSALVESSVGARLAATARRRATAPALLWIEDGEVRSLDFGALHELVEAAAARLLALAEPGDRVVLWSGNSVDWIVAEYAVATAGMVLVPTNPALTADEAGHIVADSGARVVLTGPPWHGRDLGQLAGSALPGPAAGPRPIALDVEAVTRGPALTIPAWPAVSAEDPLRIQYTSGTTGTPKGAVITHLVGANVGPLSHTTLGLHDDDVVCAPLPYHHVGGSVCTSSAALLRGSAFVVLTGFEPAATLDALRRTDATYFGGVPTMFVAMLAACGDVGPQLPRLRWIMMGGSDVAPELIARVESAFGAEILNGYGQSEAPSALQTHAGDPDEVKAATIGRANPFREARIVSPATGETAAPGETGELCLRGPLVMRRYWHEPAGQRSAVVDEQGWLHTGDLAAMDADGVVALRGRLRDLIIRGGENIYPAEVEAALAGHPAIGEIAVVAAPDPHWGQVPVAFVRPVGELPEAAELEEFARTRLAGYKVPRVWRTVECFPLTPSGKIQKFKLARLLEQSPA